MDLHTPIRDLLLKIRDRNSRRLLLATAALDGAVQNTYAQKSSKIEPHRLHGMVLATNVRDDMFWWASLKTFREQSFAVEEGTSRSMVLVDSEFVPIRLRKYPRRSRTIDGQRRSELVPVTPVQEIEGEPQQLILFGSEEDYGPVQWEPSLLWDADPATQTLRAAWLAALERYANNPRVFDRLSLPIGSPSLLFQDDLGTTKRREQELDNFSDMFEQGDMPGDSPA